MLQMLRLTTDRETAMKVSELIEKLKELPQDMEAWISLESYASEVEAVEIDKIRSVGDVVVLS